MSNRVRDFESSEMYSSRFHAFGNSSRSANKILLLSRSADGIESAHSRLSVRFFRRIGQKRIGGQQIDSHQLSGTLGQAIDSSCVLQA
jgi:hypothetical protein